MAVSDPHAPRPGGSGRRARTVVLLLLFLAAAGLALWYVWGRPSARAERLLNRARTLRLAGEREQAEQAAASALRLDERLGEAALLAAECALANNHPRRAVGYLHASDSDDPQIRLRTAIAAAALYHDRLYELSEAMDQYRIALEIDPENARANEELARLLGLCDRREEAVPYALRVLRQDVDTDLLMLLARTTMVVHNMELLKAARAADPDDPNVLVGLARQEAEGGRTDDSIALLRNAIRLRPDHAAAHVALGRQLLEARRFDELMRWEEQLPASADEFADTWLVRGQMAETADQTPAAARCYWEAVRRMPESSTASFRLARALAVLGETAASQRVAEHVERIQKLRELQNRTFFSSGHEGVEAWLALARGYETAGRLWEARAWCRMLVQRAPSYAEARRYLDQLKLRTEKLPLQLTIDNANVALAVDLSSYPLPRFDRSAASPGRSVPAAPATISFRDDAASAGLRFRYFNGSDTPTRRMFEFTGGGAGVLDFDLDGFPDVYFTQGRRWPPERPDDEHHDALFRNRGGRRFAEVTRSAGILEEGFGQGVSVGDIDADGFPDLYVANIGRNQLWRNNGDGSFTDVTGEAGLGGREWTTSCVVADLNGDGLPDIYDVNYVTADDVYDRVCPHDDGLPALCMPYHFDSQPDRLWLSDGRGGFLDATSSALSIVPEGKGLGAAVWDAHGDGRLSLLVANDTTPNFFFVRESDESGGPVLQERGIASGLAFNEEGKATGAMGIALGDIDDDGRLEVNVTNFLAEANTFWVGGPEGFFEDRTRALGLHAPSFDMLGFGTQFLDADLDGRLELFVSNGHVDDLRRFGKAYAMRAQLFRWDGRRFFEADPAELGPYFQREWLGRPVARLDWNRDGREDLLVGHLEADSSLLTNTTTRTGRFLSLRLFGVGSSRDAIGTRIEARVGGRTIARQLTAGDGYQASNERRIILGTGDVDRIDELAVRWPSGTAQRFEQVSVPGELWLREGASPLAAP